MDWESILRTNSSWVASENITIVRGSSVVIFCLGTASGVDLYAMQPAVQHRFAGTYHTI